MIQRNTNGQRMTLLAGAVVAALVAAPVSAQTASSPAIPTQATQTAATTAAEVQASQSSPAPSAQGSNPSREAEGDEAVPEDDAPSSTEQGRTGMDEAFAAKSRAQWIRETRRKAFADTKLDIQLRSYYFDRDKFDDTQSEAWALGGSIGLKTGYFRDRFAFGATGYTSQRLEGDEDKDGTLLLQPGQEGYTVLGEAYVEALLWKGARFTAGRRGFDTPYLNRNDVRMTPNTFSAAVLQGIAGGGDRPEWRYGFGYFDEIKERNSEEFVSMSEDAGAPDGVDEGVWAGGVNYTSGPFSIGAIDYWSDDIINIFYTEAKYTHALNDKVKLNFGAQYTDQQSVGAKLLTGADFDASQWGVKAELAWGGALFTTAYTSTGDGGSTQNPWSGYPGYTSVQVNEYHRTGEDAWMLRAGYNFKSVPGLGVYGLCVDGSDPEGATLYSEDECDVNVQWNVKEGPLEGLMLRLRYADIERNSPGNPNQTDFRFMVFYDVPGF